MQTATDNSKVAPEDQIFRINNFTLLVEQRRGRYYGLPLAIDNMAAPLPIRAEAEHVRKENRVPPTKQTDMCLPVYSFQAQPSALDIEFALRKLFHHGAPAEMDAIVGIVLTDRNTERITEPCEHGTYFHRLPLRTLADV